jgi:hypothetical protein
MLYMFRVFKLKYHFTSKQAGYFDNLYSDAIARKAKELVSN